MMSKLMFLALAVLSLTSTVLCDAAPKTPYGFLDNMYITGDEPRAEMETPAFTKSYDNIKYSYYSTMQLKGVAPPGGLIRPGESTVTDYLPTGSRGKEYRLACLALAWTEFYQMAKEDPKSDFILLSHLTVPVDKPLLRYHELIHNCLIFKNPSVCDKNNYCTTTGEKVVASRSYNHKVYQNLRWKFHWDVYSAGKYA